ncbi:hypothetical protein ACFQS1_37560 [Paractinoplanes rhizophilus]|jgi:hypothetical protein|uniref:Uncharacterized protein n=1 Tax=Paractinoplanes rhizophilus TaxID=1416877 RepID=A0ABW2I4G1_9ACTN|nr:hypothetical protein [Actinoplanes sp.]
MKPKPGLVPETETSATFVVYDTADGTIVHRHKVTTPVGSAEGRREDAEEAALNYAHRITGTQRDRIAVLQVADDELRPGVESRVDVETRRVVRADEAGRA